MPHSLLIAKVNAYGFSFHFILHRILKRLFEHSKLKIKIYETFSNWTNILHGVPHGSILGSLLLAVFLYDLFLFKPNIDLVSYADDR